MNITTIAVIGAGDLGRRLALLALRAGYGVILEDVSDTSLEKAMAAIRETLAEDVSAGRIDALRCEQLLLRLGTARRVDDAVREADFIVETVADELEMKLELFTIFDKFGRPGALFASTTQSLAIDDLADMTFCAERCVGMRFLDWTGQARAVELVRGRATSRETMEECGEIARRMGFGVLELCDDRTLPAASD